MAKGGFWDDTYEKLAEFGQSTAKTTAKSLNQTFNPIKILENAVATDKTNNKDKGIEQLEKGKAKKQNHTPLDFNKLQDKYKDQDKIKTENLRNRLFQFVKSGEEKTIMEKRAKEQQRKQQLIYEAQEKKKEEEKKKKAQATPIPQGKVRRSIFSPLKVARRQQMEYKPASGKQ